MVFVVIAHYKENVDWVKNLKYKYKIISRQGIQYETPPNRGNEASSYLEYIIENYDNLDDVTVFVHAHRSDWHHVENIDEKINRMAFDKNYYNFNTNDNNNSLTTLTGFPSELAKTKALIPSLESVLNIKINPDKIIYRNSAQFYVKKDVIRKYSKEVYYRLYIWLMVCPESTYWTSRVFEYIWHIIFTGNHVDVL